MSQLVSADKAVWQLLIEEDVKPRRDAAGNLALDTKLIEALQSYQVAFTLLPLPAKKSESQSSNHRPQPYSENRKGSSKGKKFIQPYWNFGKSFGKGKASKGKPRVPAEIMKLGGVASNPDGEPVCFPYNCEGGCPDAADGAKCRRGLHVCAKCFGLHSILNHGKQS